MWYNKNSGKFQKRFTTWLGDQLFKDSETLQWNSTNLLLELFYAHLPGSHTIEHLSKYAKASSVNETPHLFRSQPQPLNKMISLPNSMQTFKRRQWASSWYGHPSTHWLTDFCRNFPAYSTDFKEAKKRVFTKLHLLITRGISRGSRQILITLQQFQWVIHPWSSVVYH